MRKHTPGIFNRDKWGFFFILHTWNFVLGKSDYRRNLSRQETLHQVITLRKTVGSEMSKVKVTR